MQSSINKLFKILLINLLLIFSVFIVLNHYTETVLIKGECKKVEQIRKKVWNTFIKSSLDSKINIDDYDVEPLDVKKIELNNKSYKKYCGENRVEIGLDKGYIEHPIIIMGCSYAYGHGLNKEQSFGNLLSNLTTRPIFNFSVCGGNLISSFNSFDKYMKEADEANLERIKQSEYVIYLYMWDHINRYINVDMKYLYNNYDDFFNPKGIEKSVIRIPLIKYSLMILRLRSVLKNYPNNDKASILLKTLIINTKNKLKVMLPNSKMIVIIYDEKIPNTHSPSLIKFSSDMMKDKMWQALQKDEDIIVVHTKDVTEIVYDKNYKLKEDIADWHPNEKAWELFSPLFVEQYIK